MSRVRFNLKLLHEAYDYSFPGLAFQFRKSDQDNGAHIYDLIFAGKVLPTPSREFINIEFSVNLKVFHFSSIEQYYKRPF